jgi:hypothetical protein
MLEMVAIGAQEHLVLGLQSSGGDIGFASCLICIHI